MLFSYCLVEDFSMIDFNDAYTFIEKTEEENTLICPPGSEPQNALAIEYGFHSLRIQKAEIKDSFGVLSNILKILQKVRIYPSIVSTFQTDYLFIKDQEIDKVLSCLPDNAYQIIFQNQYINKKQKFEMCLENKNNLGECEFKPQKF